MISQLENTFDLDCSSCPRSLAVYSESLKNVGTDDDARFAMVYGTERGSLHYRTFPLSKPSIVSASSASSFSAVPTVDYVGTPGGIIQTGAIVGCIPAIIPDWNQLEIEGKDKFSSSSSSSPPTTDSLHRTKESPTAQVMLLLRDDNRGVGGAHSTSPGAYAASLNVLQYSNFTALTSIPWIHPQHPTTTSASSQTLGNLPRMSCASYHPNTGFVYAAGTSVCSAPPNVLYSVALTLALAMNHNNHSTSLAETFDVSSISSPTNSATINSPSSSYYSSSSTSILVQRTLSNLMSLLPKFYFYAKNILPPPGARCTGSSCNEALGLVCQGRVAIIPVGNSFWAVPGVPVPHRLYQIWKNASSTTIDWTSLSSWDSFVDELPPLSNHQTVLKSSETSSSHLHHDRVEKILTFHQSSQVHPTIVIEIPTAASSCQHTVHTRTFRKGGDSWTGMSHSDNNIIPSLIFLASGKECAVLEIFYNPNKVSTTSSSSIATATNSTAIATTEMQLYEEATVDHEETTISKGLIGGCILYGPPRHGIITWSSPILSATGLPWVRTEGSNEGVCQSPMIAILTADGMIELRSFSCIAVPISTISIGSRPNDYFLIRSLPNYRLVALSYSGQATLLSTRVDTSQDFSDRLMKLCIDAFGCTGFPRILLAEAMGTSFSATTYPGMEPTKASKNSLKQYLEAILGLDVNDDYGPAMIRSLIYQKQVFHNLLLLSSTGILCLVCTQLSPPNAALANRAAKACSMYFGVVSPSSSKALHDSVVQLIQTVVDSLLREASNFVLLAPSSSTILNPNIRSSNKTGLNMDLTEAALWLLRACGDHQRAIQELQDFMNNPSLRNKGAGSISSITGQVSWNQVKFESYLTSHLGELWKCEDDECKQIVLRNTATRQLLENNPRLGLSIFTSPLPQNEEQWIKMDTMSSSTMRIPMYCFQVVEMLKSIRPRRVTTVSNESTTVHENYDIPLESGLAMAISFLEDAIGISTGRITQQTNTPNEDGTELVSDLHDQLAILLLEAIISERGIDSDKPDSALGILYRKRLHRLFKWPYATLRSDSLISVLPSSFLHERSLLLGRLGRHKEALQILYCELHSIDMALEYCDVLYSRQMNQQPPISGEDSKEYHLSPSECAYLPLISVVLHSDPDPQRGISAAINILSLRRNKIHLTSALQMLPADLPVSVIARSFLIPSIIENESEVRRLKMISSLLRTKYTSLKKKIIESEIESQSDIDHIILNKKIDLGDLLNISRPLQLYPLNQIVDFPEIEVTKYFYPRYLVVKTKITNLHWEKPLANVVLNVAESSDEALIPSFTVPIKILLPKKTAVSWCVLTSSPQRIDGVSVLACELRYTILGIDPVSGAPLNFSAESDYTHQMFVEELHDIEIRHTDYFSRS